LIDACFEAPVYHLEEKCGVFDVVAESVAPSTKTGAKLFTKKHENNSKITSKSVTCISKRTQKRGQN
jgi:hypothetical protein